MTGSGASTAADREAPRDAGTPAEAGTGAESRSRTEPVAGRVHRVVVPTPLVLATVIGIGATFAIWVNRQALNTSNWSSTSSKILEDKQGQTVLSAYLVHELFTNVNVSADLHTVLTKQLRPPAGPAAAGLRQAHARKTAPSPRPLAADAQVAAAPVHRAVPAPASGHVETLERLAVLRSSGAITDEEFAAEKTYVMNNGT